MARGLEGRFHGSYHRLEDPGVEHRVDLSLRASVNDKVRFLREWRAEVAGEIDAEALASKKAVEGMLLIRLREGRLLYELRFPGDDGREHRASGETELDPRRPLRALRELAAHVYVDDREIARMILRLPPSRELADMFRGLGARFTTRGR